MMNTAPEMIRGSVALRRLSSTDSPAVSVYAGETLVTTVSLYIQNIKLEGVIPSPGAEVYSLWNEWVAGKF